MLKNFKLVLAASYAFLKQFFLFHVFDVTNPASFLKNHIQISLNRYPIKS